MHQQFIISLFGGRQTLVITNMSEETTKILKTVLDIKKWINLSLHLPIESQRIQFQCKDLNDEKLLTSIIHQKYDGSKIQLVFMNLTLRLLGGKGGFGANLKSAGGRMSNKVSTNTDACRDLGGRRLKTLNEARRYNKSKVKTVFKMDHFIINSIM